MQLKRLVFAMRFFNWRVGHGVLDRMWSPINWSKSKTSNWYSLLILKFYWLNLGCWVRAWFCWPIADLSVRFFAYISNSRSHIHEQPACVKDLIPMWLMNNAGLIPAFHFEYPRNDRYQLWKLLTLLCLFIKVGL